MQLEAVRGSFPPWVLCCQGELWRLGAQPEGTVLGPVSLLGHLLPPGPAVPGLCSPDTPHGFHPRTSASLSPCLELTSCRAVYPPHAHHSLVTVCTSLSPSGVVSVTLEGTGTLLSLIAVALEWLYCLTWRCHLRSSSHGVLCLCHTCVKCFCVCRPQRIHFADGETEA